MKKTVENIGCAAVMALSLTACDNKNLCFDHGDHAPRCQAHISVQYELQWQYTFGNATDWRAEWPAEFGMDYDGLLPSIPTGLRMVSYDADGSCEINNLPPSGGPVYFRTGMHSLLFYNNDTEYIVFNDLHSFAAATATTRSRSRSRSTYIGNRYIESKGEENTVNPPDVLFGHYVESYINERSVEPRPLPIVMRPLVFTYLVRYEFRHGLNYVALARGALAGMAGTVFLNSGQTASEAVTILYDCTVEDFGAGALVRSFGVPDFAGENYSRSMRRYGLNLEVKLKNGKSLTFDFDVTDQVASQPRGGVIIVRDIEIPDEEGRGYGSGFDVNVNDWGEFCDIDLPL